MHLACPLWLFFPALPKGSPLPSVSKVQGGLLDHVSEALRSSSQQLSGNGMMPTVSQGSLEAGHTPVEPGVDYSHGRDFDCNLGAVLCQGTLLGCAWILDLQKQEAGL